MKKIEPSINWTIEKIAASALFDAQYYLDSYPDMVLTELEAFEHYCKYGWREGKDPSSHFSTKFYLEENLDVAMQDINPLGHYALYGTKEGRAALPTTKPLDSGKEVVLRALSARDRARSWCPVSDVRSPISCEDIYCILLYSFESNRGSGIISISHDQYIKSIGGVQATIASEQNIFTDAGWIYIHLCPALPLPMLGNSNSEHAHSLVLTVAGERRGVVRLGDFLEAAARVTETTGKSLRLIIHHLMGFSVEAIKKISSVCKAGIPTLWVHDFFSLCANPFLLRNELDFCAAPPINSSACLVCCEGADRKSHIESVQSLFKELRPVVIAPSATALNFWKSKGAFEYSKALVLPLAHVELGGKVISRNQRPLKVAHLGAAAPHKGWAVFRKLVERHAIDERYEFFRLGVGSSELRGLQEVFVESSAMNPDAMIDAVLNYEIDVVINWSSCFETFSYVTLEALTGGAFVIGRSGAGNVWPAVVATNASRGMEIATELQLRSIFITGEIIKRAPGRLTRGKLLRSSGTADLLLKEEHFA